MGGRKFLIIPGNNSLSHVVKALAVSTSLKSLGHEAAVAVSRKNAPFLKQLVVDHLLLPDIQESDESGFPSVEWFRHPRHIVDCINAEVALLQAYRPDRVLGVFRFTLKAAAKITGIPYDSLACGCMIPDSQEVLGFAEGEAGREIQQRILDGFYRYAGAKLGVALTSFGLADEAADIRQMLKGERTFLWDFPQFAPVPQKNDLIHVGPLSWNRWPYDAVADDELFVDGEPLAVVAFGTCTVCLPAVRRIIRVLVDLGYRVLLAAGGQKEFFTIMPDEPRVLTRLFAPLPDILPHAALLVTHGGQMTVFEALLHEVPVLVMPFQPEQAHNGVCLERIGCGSRLVPSRPFQGNSDIFLAALERMTDAEIAERIGQLVRSPETKSCLAATVRIISRYEGAAKIAAMLVEC